MRHLTLYALVALAVCVLTPLAIVAQAASPAIEEAEDAVNYMRTIQNADGGFPSFAAGGDSSAGATVDAVFAFVVAGVDPETVQNGGNSPVDYLETQAATYSDTAGGAAKLVMAAAALGINPGDFGGVDLLAKMDALYNSGTGQYGGGALDQALYILAQTSVERTVPPEATDYLKSKQLPSGGWEYTDGWGADTNTTAMAIMALVGAGTSPASSSVQGALGYLAGAQNSDAGWPYDPLSPWGTGTDANSTALVIQALVAAAEEIDDWAKGSTTPLDALLLLQLGSGAFEWQPGYGANPLATYQAVPALLLEPLPVATMSLATPTPTQTATFTPSPTPQPTLTPTRTPSPSPTPPPSVGGLVKLPPAAAALVSEGRETASSTPGAVALIGGVLAGGVVVLGTAAWHARRRWE